MSINIGRWSISYRDLVNKKIYSSILYPNKLKNIPTTRTLIRIVFPISAEDNSLSKFPFYYFLIENFKNE